MFLYSLAPLLHFCFEFNIIVHIFNRAEKLQLLNLRPTTPVEIQLVSFTQLILHTPFWFLRIIIWLLGYTLYSQYFFQSYWFCQATKYSIFSNEHQLDLVSVVYVTMIFFLFLLSKSQYSVKLSVLSYRCCCFAILSLDHWRQRRTSENWPRDWRTFECDCYKTTWHSWRNSVWRKARRRWRNGVIDTQNVLRIYNTLIDHKEDIKNMFLFFTSQILLLF